MQETETFVAFSVKHTAVRPPQNIILIHISFPMSGISASAGSFPETSHHFLWRNITPAVLNIAFVCDLIQYNRFLKPLSPLINQLGRFVQILSLDTAVCDPRSAVIVERDTVVDGTQMIVRIFLTDDLCVTLPVFHCFFWEQIIFICQCPPDVSVCTETRNHVFPVQVILLFRHLGKSPAVIRMHHNQIRLDAKVTQRQDAFFNMLKMCRIESLKIPVITFGLSGIFQKVFFGQHTRIHRCSFIWIRARFPQVVIIMFREHAETNLVKRTVFQCFQRLCDQFVRL